MAAVVRSRTWAIANPSRPHIAVCLAPTHVSRRQHSSNVVKGQHGNLAAYKRGTGGRSSFSGVVATVFGASGYLGRYVVNKLGKVGCQIICPHRSDVYHSRHLKVAGDLGQVLFVPIHLRDDESIRKSMKYSNVVINLIGKDFETKNFKYHDVNVEGAARIARLAKEMGVEKLIHVSHLRAQPNPPPIVLKGGSEFLKSKYYGELAVREEFPEAVIIRPADIFGHEDRFFRYWSKRFRRVYPWRVPLWKRGTQTVKMPVFVSDVAQGITNAVFDPESPGQVYECVGPHSYYLSEIVDYMYRCLRIPEQSRTWITPFFLAKVKLVDTVFPHTPLMSVDKLSAEHVSDILHDERTLADLGVNNLLRLEDRAEWELKVMRRDRQVEEEVGAYPTPYPPRIIPA